LTQKSKLSVPIIDAYHVAVEVLAICTAAHDTELYSYIEL